VKVSTQQLPESQVLLEIEVDSEQFEKSMDRAYRKLVQRVDVPGFRKGKAPKNMLERHVGRGRILEEAIDIAVPEAYNKALEEQDIDAIGRPQIELLSAEPLSFKATVPLRPKIELGDYRSIRVAREPSEVDENDVEKTLLELRQRYAIHQPVDRPVQVNDIIRADVKIVVDGREVFNDDDAELHLREGRTVLLPGFTEGVVGAKKGEPKDVEVTIPDDAEVSLAGKTAKVSVTVKEVKEESLPDPDDEFAKQVGEGFEGIEALRERLRSDIRERLEEHNESKFRDDAVAALVEGAAAIEFPPVLVDHEMDHFLGEQLRQSGLEKERYFQMINKSEEQFREELRPSATERVKRSLVLGQLAEDEALEVGEEDLQSEIASFVAQASGGDEEQAMKYESLFNAADARASLANSLLTRKTMDRLVEIAGQTDGSASAGAKKKTSTRAKKKEEEQDA
jgi:trigger factor